VVIGVVFSFLACCLGGRWVSRQLLYTNFVRFHQMISPQSQFFPTACQVEKLAEAQASPDQILVVVGGNSIAFGVGQREEQVWTKKLQALLGDHYRVINLAMPSGGTMEFAGVVSEILAQRHAKILFVTTANVGGAADASSGFYRYFFWDAVYKGLLPNDAEHQAWVKHVMEGHTNEKTMPELQREMQVDRVVYGRDLWTAIAYRKCSLVWNPFVNNTFGRARRKYKDPDTGPLVPFSLRCPAANDAAYTELVRRELQAELGLRLARPPLLQSVESVFPPSSRVHSLILLPMQCPYYVKCLTPNERQHYYWLYERASNVLEQAGIAAQSLGKNWTREDYYDLVHPSESGGAKMAEMVAPRLREMSQRLGYTKGYDLP
jgi:hypothetical protein